MSNKISTSAWMIVGALAIVLIGLIIYFTNSKNNSIPFLQNAYENYQRGQEYAKENNFQEAVGYFQDAVNSRPNNHSYVVELATAKYNLKEYDQAIEHFKKAIKLDGSNAFVYNSLANAYRDNGQLQEAVKYYTKSVEVNPKFTIAYHNWAMALDADGKSDEAKRVVEEGLQSNPGSAELKKTLETIGK